MESERALDNPPPPSLPGTYALGLCSDASAIATVGRLGRVRIVRGFYVYIGSAFGPGGLRARLQRHSRTPTHRHWHIDYLLARIEPVQAWFCPRPVRLEHRWARALMESPNVTSVRGFGCSDCSCPSHLFHTAVPPEPLLSRAFAGCELETWKICR